MRSSCSRRSSDVLSLLINIYGSKALFVNEFRSMLADKLLSTTDYDTDKEVIPIPILMFIAPSTKGLALPPFPLQIDVLHRLISSGGLATLLNPCRYCPTTIFTYCFRSYSLLSDQTSCPLLWQVRHLELLKKRFGDNALTSCEVMLKDIAESKRVTYAIHKHFGDDQSKVLTATVVSRLCWPTLDADKFELPEGIAREFARFEKQFMHLKVPPMMRTALRSMHNSSPFPLRLPSCCFALLTSAPGCKIIISPTCRPASSPLMRLPSSYLCAPLPPHAVSGATESRLETYARFCDPRCGLRRPQD